VKLAAACSKLETGNPKLLFRIAIPAPAQRGTGRIEHLFSASSFVFQIFQSAGHSKPENLKLETL
jgi:hypothetical protein